MLPKTLQQPTSFRSYWPTVHSMPLHVLSTQLGALPLHRSMVLPLVVLQWLSRVHVVLHQPTFARREFELFPTSHPTLPAPPYLYIVYGQKAHHLNTGTSS